MKKREGRVALASQVKIETKQQLADISKHHKAKGSDHMSMTHVLEVLVAKEHKRLKL